MSEATKRPWRVDNQQENARLVVAAVNAHDLAVRLAEAVLADPALFQDSMRWREIVKLARRLKKQGGKE